MDLEKNPTTTMTAVLPAKRTHSPMRLLGFASALSALLVVFFAMIVGANFLTTEVAVARQTKSTVQVVNVSDIRQTGRSAESFLFNNAEDSKEGAGEIVKVAGANVHMPLAVAPLLRLELLNSIKSLYITRPICEGAAATNTSLSNDSSTAEDSEYDEPGTVTEQYTLTGYTKRSRYSLVFHTTRGDTIVLEHGEATVRSADGTKAYPVCFADVECSAFHLADFSEAESLMAQVRSMYPESTANRRLVDTHNNRRLGGCAWYRLDCHIVSGANEVAGIAGMGLAEVSGIVIDAVSRLLERMLTELTFAGCSVLTEHILTQLQRVGKQCIDPLNTCGLNLGEKTFELLVGDDNGAYLTIATQNTLEACFQIESVEFDCDKLTSSVSAIVSDWLNDNFKKPVKDAIEDALGVNRRALKALSTASASDFNDHKFEVIAQVEADAKRILLERLAHELVEKDKHRRLSGSEDASFAIEGISLRLSFEAESTVTANAVYALDEAYEVDLLADEDGKPFKMFDIDAKAGVPLTLGLLTGAFKAGLELQLPLKVHATATAQGEARATAHYKRDVRVLITPDGTSQTELERVEEVNFAAGAGVAASLSVSLGVLAKAHIGVELVVAAVVSFFAEAEVNWEAKIGADGVACATAGSPSDFMCENMHTRLTPYVEYAKSSVGTIGNGDWGMGYWAYVSAPQIIASAGIRLPAGGALEQCSGTRLQVSWSSNFGDSWNDGLGGVHHPFGGLLFRTAKVASGCIPGVGCFLHDKQSLDSTPGVDGAAGMALCQGDCDTDADCASGLVCFQRSGFTAVPGCSGQGTEGWDYCVTPFLDSSPGVNPTPAGVGTLGLCEGDCDRDSDCASGLVCHQRSGFTAVPGCDGEGTEGWDYCVQPSLDSSPGVSGTAGTAHSVGYLGLCQGDCDGDDDCAVGLVCHQRSGFTAVPGCAGTGVKNWDYCVGSDKKPLDSAKLDGGGGAAGGGQGGEPRRQVEHEHHRNDYLERPHDNLGDAMGHDLLQYRRVASQPRDDLAALVLVEEGDLLSEDSLEGHQAKP